MIKDMGFYNNPTLTDQQLLKIKSAEDFLVLIDNSKLSSGGDDYKVSLTVSSANDIKIVN